MKYAISREMMGKSFSTWTVKPWKLMGLKEYDTTVQIPDDAILIASHYAPWWSPLKEYIAEGRPWIEIDYSYWGTKNTVRRVTYNGHHNLRINDRPFSRSHLFATPQQQNWKNDSSNEFVLGILPIESLLQSPEIVHCDQHLQEPTVLIINYQLLLITKKINSILL
jgi:hypothetical protein